jgi:hypothetical protein
MTGLFGTASYTGPASTSKGSTASKPRTGACVSPEVREWLAHAKGAHMMSGATRTFTFYDSHLALQGIRAGVTRIDPTHAYD